MAPDEFLPLPLMREHCGLAGASGDGDSSLETHRLAVAARIESITGRRIITVNGIRAESVSTAEDRFLVFPIPDFQIPDTGMEVLYRPADMEDGLETPMRFAVAKGNVDIRKRDFRVLNTGIPARNMNVPYAAFVESGMTAGQMPPEFRSAGLFMVRELFEGSAMDQIDKGSVLDSLLRDHHVPRMTADIFNFVQAGRQT